VRPRGQYPVGEHMVNAVTTKGYTHRTAELIYRDRPYGYHLGSLEAARNAFVKTAHRSRPDWVDLVGAPDPCAPRSRCPVSNSS
jgi:hypothetical protein